MIVLGIETSCDETSVAVVRDGVDIYSHCLASSVSFHRRYGGIIPEIAFRVQMETIAAITQQALTEARIKPRQIKLIAVTSHPGLEGSLIVGKSFAQAIAWAWNKPLVEVDHLHAHIYAACLKEKTDNKNQFRLPIEQTKKIPNAVSLVVSGGHTSLFRVKDFSGIKLLGSTVDDACGEAFDKVAKILNLGYPGGPQIEKLAKEATQQTIKFRCSQTKQPLDFSFSGIKTAVLYLVRELTRKNKTPEHAIIADICASFQKAVTDVLITKTMLACKKTAAKILILGGGVIANTYIRSRFQEACLQNNLRLYMPPISLCTDNAAMVAGLAYQQYKIKKVKNKKGGDAWMS